MAWTGDRLSRTGIPTVAVPSKPEMITAIAAPTLNTRYRVYPTRI